jgi:hypothetical protein
MCHCAHHSTYIRLMCTYIRLMCVCTYSHFHNDRLFFSVKKRVFVHFRTETLRTKLEPVHFRSGIESRVFFSGKKKVNHYENESKGL